MERYGTKGELQIQVLPQSKKFSTHALWQCDDAQKDNRETMNAGARQKATSAAVQEPRSSLQQSLQRVCAALNPTDWQQHSVAKER